MTFLPRTSTGPSAYLLPSSSQATNGLAGSLTWFWDFNRPAAVLQSVASHTVATSAVSHASSLASVGLGFGDVAGLAAALAAPVGVGVPAASSPPPLADEVTEGLPDAAAEALLDAAGLGLAEPEGVPVGVGVGTVGCCATSTGRNSRAADLRIDCRVASSMFLPGRVTTMLSVPCVVISASVTPDPFTRCRMILTASSMVVAVIWPDWPA